MTTARVLPIWQPLSICSDTGCLQDAAYDRADGRCYRHGKIADGLMQQYVAHAGRPATAGVRPVKGRAHHNKH